MEAQYLVAVGGRALGEENYRHARVERLADFFIGVSRVSSDPSAAHENSAGIFREPADKRPSFHLGFGHENTRQDGAVNQNVEIAEMIA